MNHHENEAELFEQFNRLQWLLHRYHQQNHRQHGPMGDPHRGQGRVLSLLRLQPKISQRELSYLLDMRPQSLGELLIKLERSGYIERTPSESDRRVMNIALTEQGKQAAGEGEARPDAAGLFDCLSEEEREQFGEFIARIIESLEEQLGEEVRHPDFDWRFGRHPGMGRHDERGFGGFGPDGMRRDGHFEWLNDRDRGRGERHRRPDDDGRDV